MKIIIETIPHDQQRYPTVGDWYYDENGDLRIKVSAMSSEKYEQLVAVHELVEVLLCRHQGISQQAVDAFDTEYERNRQPDNNNEPGDEPSAPYAYQHCLATSVERMLAAEFGVSWGVYADVVESL